MSRVRSLATALVDAAASETGLTAIEHDGRTIHLSYRSLLAESCAIGGALLGRGLSTGDHVALILPDVNEFIRAFFGVAVAGRSVPRPHLGVVLARLDDDPADLVQRDGESRDLVGLDRGLLRTPGHVTLLRPELTQRLRGAQTEARASGCLFCLFSLKETQAAPLRDCGKRPVQAACMLQWRTRSPDTLISINACRAQMGFRASIVAWR
mgnify:CR=1 FL=1